MAKPAYSGKRPRRRTSRYPTQSVPKMPDMSHVNEFTWEVGPSRRKTSVTVSWDDISRRYREQIEGQKGRKPKSEMREELVKKREAFEKVAKVAYLLRETSLAYDEIGDLLKIEPATIKYWANKGGLPAQISPRIHVRGQESRRQLDFDSEKRYDLGYVLGTIASGRLSTKGDRQPTRYKLIVTDEPTADAFVNSFERVFHLRPVKRLVASKGSKGGSTFNVVIDSRNFARYWSSVISNPQEAVSILPNHPEARHGFTHAAYDFGEGRVVRDQNSPRVILWHTPDVTAVVSKTLDEFKIPNTAGDMRNRWGISVPKGGLRSFKEHIGYRNPVRHGSIQTEYRQVRHR